jgi:hypothetical protein
MGQIRRQIIVAGAAPVPIRLSASNRTILRNDSGPIAAPTGALVNIAYQRDLFGINVGESNQSFTMLVGDTYVFDANPITGNTDVELGDLFYIYCPLTPSGNATIEVWQQGITQTM